jgi:hypothetical protein
MDGKTSPFVEVHPRSLFYGFCGGSVFGVVLTLAFRSPDGILGVVKHGLDKLVPNSFDNLKTSGDPIIEQDILAEQKNGPLNPKRVNDAIQLAFRRGPPAFDRTDRLTTLVPGFTKTTLWDSKGSYQRQALQATILFNLKTQQPDVKIDYERLARLGKLNTAYIFPQEVYDQLAIKVIENKMDPDIPAPVLPSEKVAKGIADLLWKQSADEL